MTRGILVNYRLWNLDGAETEGLHTRNDDILAALHAAFPDEWDENSWGWRLAPGVFVQYGERFEWPELSARDRGARERCLAPCGSEAAVLCDGTVVPAVSITRAT